jgi:hypothetical protein
MSVRRQAGAAKHITQNPHAQHAARQDVDHNHRRYGRFTGAVWKMSFAAGLLPSAVPVQTSSPKSTSLQTLRFARLLPKMEQEYSQMKGELKKRFAAVDRLPA